MYGLGNCLDNTANYMWTKDSLVKLNAKQQSAKY